MKFRENAVLTFLNNKAKVPVGEPLQAYQQMFEEIIDLLG